MFDPFVNPTRPPRWPVRLSAGVEYPDGYGSTWGPLGDRYVMPPRRWATSRRAPVAPPPPAPRVIMAMAPAQTTSLPRGALALARRCARRECLGRVTVALVELPPDTRHPDPRLIETYVVRFTDSTRGLPGFAAWENGKFVIGMLSNGAILGARAINEAVDGG